MLRSPQVLQLQRTAGNRAVTGLADAVLTQREAPPARPPPDLRRGAVTGLARADALAKVQVAYFEQCLQDETDPTTRKHDQQMLKMYREFPSTRVAPVRSLSARVLRSRSFFPGSPLEVLKRGHTVTVLGMTGSWCRVRTSSGTEGWMHQNRIFPRVAVFKWMKSGGTGGGTTQDPKSSAMTGRG